MLLTFTRRAASEMLKRANALLEKQSINVSRIWGGTFHATGNRLLRIHAGSIGLSPDFTVMDQSDSADLMDVIRQELDITCHSKRFPRKSTCNAIYGRCVECGESVDQVLKRHFPWCSEWTAELKQLFKAYVTRKQENVVLDYSDLLLYWSQMLKDPGLCHNLCARFEHILVDEYQDTNPLQAEILQGMRQHNSNLTAVGDDAQSIYAFRGASAQNMITFPQTFGETRIVKLEQNYRSTPEILNATNTLISAASEGYRKRLWSSRPAGGGPYLITCKDEAAQDEFVVDTILKHYEEGIPLKQQAVLTRVGHLLDSLEIVLNRRNIPYHKYGGLRFLEAGHVKDVISFLRIADNPRDTIAWIRILQMIEGVGPRTAARVVKHLGEYDFDPTAFASLSNCPPPAREPFRDLSQMFSDLFQEGQQKPASQVQRIRLFYDPLLQRNYSNATARSHDVEHLEQIATGYKTRQAFLTQLVLDPPNSTGDLAGPPTIDEDWLVLSTIHSAKGCEWDVVTLIHAADGWLPSDLSAGSKEELEEERRLAYVAMTRARDHLYVTWPLRYYHRKRRRQDEHSYAQRSRFLTPEVLQHFQRYSPSSDSSVMDEKHLPASDISTNVMQRLTDMWD
jgi:DNA helicase-2/ATP-dependent DNA helicase PcrA